MQSLTINFQNPQIFDKFLLLLDSFKKDGVEVVSKDDIDDLKALSKTREEESIPFEEYLKDAH
jgi:hypothetical protein